MPGNKPVGFEDTQGIVRFGHGQLPCSLFVLVAINDVDLAKQWIRSAPVTTSEYIKPPPKKALQLAFTCSGLAALDISDSVLSGFSDEFVAGMTEPNRSRRLGDIVDNAPENWQWGNDPETVPHLLVMLYSRTDGMEEWKSEVLNQLFEQAFRVISYLPSNEEVTSEPFGFADGISQPSIDWEQEQSIDVHQRDRYSNLLALGEILLGYVNEYGEYTARPLLDSSIDRRAELLPDAEDNPAMKDLGRNGSYLVFRQLDQDVHGFWQYFDKISGNQPGQSQVLAEAMVGRRMDGSPLVSEARQLIPGIDERIRSKNNFHYESDPDGIACPLGSHVRRSNPRTGDFPPGTVGFIARMKRILGFASSSESDDLVASTRFHRVLRRGRQYGPVLDKQKALQEDESSESRGLHFICLSANIARQFEFVQNAWIVNSKFGGLPDVADPVMGNREPMSGGSSTDNFSQPHPSGYRRCFGDIPGFVTVVGGAYFFLPGIRALRYISSTDSPDDEQEQT